MLYSQLIRGAALVAWLAGSLVSAQAGLLGSTVQASILYPDPLTTAEDLTTFTITGTTSIDSGFDDFTVTFTDTRVIVSNHYAGAFNPVFNPVFNALQLNFLSGYTLSTASLDPASTFSGAVSVKGNVLQVDFDGACQSCKGGEQALIDVPTPSGSTPLPEPATWLFTVSGLAGLGWYRRRFAAARA